MKTVRIAEESTGGFICTHEVVTRIISANVKDIWRLRDLEE